MTERELALQEIKYLLEGTKGPFPYKDMWKMGANDRLASHFKALGDDNFLTADLNTYFMCINGIASRLLQGTEDDTPKKSLQWLALGDFFAIFPKYRFLEGEWEAFSQFAHMYVSMKRMQEIELALLLTKDELLALKQQNPCKDWGHFLGPLTVIIIDGDEGELLDNGSSETV